MVNLIERGVETFYRISDFYAERRHNSNIVYYDFIEKRPLEMPLPESRETKEDIELTIYMRRRHKRNQIFRL